MSGSSLARRLVRIKRIVSPSRSRRQQVCRGLDGISPIAEALLKTLAGKARTGRLDELTALELLHKAVLL